MRLNKINQVLGQVNSAELVNGHLAYYISVEGQHTPGINSDAVYLNKDSAEHDRESPKVLAMVCDGVTGAPEYAQAGFGKFAAQYFCENLPKFWHSTAFRGNELGHFSERSVLPRFEGNGAGLNLINWLIENWSNDNPLFPSDTCRIMLRTYWDLFFRMLPAEYVAGLSGRDASAIARKVVLNEEHFKQVLQLMMGLYNTAVKGRFEATALLERHKAGGRRPYAMTTCCGAIESEKEYMFFSVGDSMVMALDGIGLVPNSKTKAHYQGQSKNMPSNVGWDEKHLYLPSGCKVENGVLAKNSKISITFVSKEDLGFHREFAIVLISDGLKYKHRAEEEIAENISHRIHNCRHSLAEIILDALDMDDKVKAFNPAYSPDDKTMVVIRKDFAKAA